MKRIRRVRLSSGKQRLDVANAADFSELIDESCILEDCAGRPLIVYLELEGVTLDALGGALKGIKYEKSGRTSGLPTMSRVFGYQPRITIRRDFCTAATLNKDWQAYYHIKNGAELASLQYARFNSDLFADHMKQAAKTNPAWRIGPDIPFTSGIINKNNQLRYHFDSGNFKGVWSAMFVFKKDVEGGYLSVPEYSVGFALKSSSLLLFDGQSILHGVTPIKSLSPYAYRYSIVYYSLAGLWKCLSPQEELARIRKVKTGREQKRMAHPPA